MQFCLPVELVLNNRRRTAVMGPFQHSPEREFAMTVNRRAIDDCNDLASLKTVTKNLLEGWSMMNTALQRLMLENIELRQAIDLRDSSLAAADAMISEAAESLKKYEQQSTPAKKGLWPFGR